MFQGRLRPRGSHLHGQTRSNRESGLIGSPHSRPSECEDGSLFCQSQGETRIRDKVTRTPKTYKRNVRQKFDTCKCKSSDLSVLF
jgi:hypothetical protein